MSRPTRQVGSRPDTPAALMTWLHPTAKRQAICPAETSGVGFPPAADSSQAGGLRERQGQTGRQRQKVRVGWGEMPAEC